eukprot:gnl/Chilomastix_cuspidata/1554.p1 GENE.gnl/Chilomastix_cuspidata/1554~~gnl/Chilomastix_cuspidata/1554.p1  ORF type:complete len:389 (+),score=103.29 gnl/Chilomastix_cuspidata/1554:129-1295(+)
MLFKISTPLSGAHGAGGASAASGATALLCIRGKENVSEKAHIVTIGHQWNAEEDDYMRETVIVRLIPGEQEQFMPRVAFSAINKRLAFRLSAVPGMERAALGPVDLLFRSEIAEEFLEELLGESSVDEEESDASNAPDARISIGAKRPLPADDDDGDDDNDESSFSEELFEELMNAELARDQDLLARAGQRDRGQAGQSRADVLRKQKVIASLALKAEQERIERRRAAQCQRTSLAERQVAPAAKPRVASAQFRKLSSGIRVRTDKRGHGPPIRVGQRARVEYVLWRRGEETPLDATPEGKYLEFRIGAGQVMRGVDLVVEQMRTGEVRHAIVPPELGFGGRGPEGLPPDAVLELQLKLLAINPRACSPLREMAGARRCERGVFPELC